MAEDFTKLNEHVEQFAKNLEKSHKSAQGLSFSFVRMASAFGAGEFLKEQIGAAIKRSDIYLKITEQLSATNLDINKLTEKRKSMEEKLLLYKSQYDAQSGSEDYERIVAQQETAIRQADKQLGLAKAVGEVGRAHYAVVALAGAAGLDLFLKQRAFNQNLIEANSHWLHRVSLMHGALQTQIQLGVDFEKATEAARALVHFGMDTEASYERNLKLVVQMDQGLGVAVGASARLASIVERQLKGSFTGVADVLAEIVNDTALAGDEAASLAATISTALGRLQPGMSAATLPDVLRLVGRYESALKEIGGQAGGFQQLLSQLTTPEGIVGAGALGVSPEFLASEQGIKMVMDRFAQYGEALVGQSQGWERQMRLQALAQVFNVTADQANQMLMAIKRTNEQQTQAITAADRWREQMNAADQGFVRLRNSLWGLVQQAVWPFVFVIGALANKLASLLEIMNSVKGLNIVLSAATLAGILVSVGKLGGLLTSVLGTSKITMLAPLLAGLKSLSTPLALIRAILFSWTIPIMGLVGLATLFGAILDVNKKSLAEQLTSKQSIMVKEDTLIQRARSRIYSLAREGGSPEEVRAAVDSLVRKVISLNPADAAGTGKKLAEELTGVRTDLLRSVVSGGMFTPRDELTPDEKKRQEAILAIMSELVVVNKKSQSVIETRAQQEAQRAQEASVESQKRNLYQMYAADYGIPFSKWKWW